MRLRLQMKQKEHDDVFKKRETAPLEYSPPKNLVSVGYDANGSEVP